ncbi:hypothetical protein Ahy_A09g046230 [Arachis hypogaea]|uniref:F-box domain-containing protein n=1 Tax=Arachis hypogaea TaxID=3818 RepID=A0A445BP69_ARAHY|nr:hypothetical protein Ahy_A09g046230 [Arachis hypogaea]
MAAVDVTEPKIVGITHASIRAHHEILTRLPLTTLLRFCSVCKSWNSLITDPSFALNHLHATSFHRLIFTRLADPYFTDYSLSSAFTSTSATVTRLFPSAVPDSHFHHSIVGSWFILWDLIHGEGFSTFLSAALRVVMEDSHFTDVLIMKDYGIAESWTKLLCVPDLIYYPEFLGFDFNVPRATRAICISDKNDEILLELWLDMEQKFIVYNFSDDSFRPAGIEKFGGRVTSEPTQLFGNARWPEIAGRTSLSSRVQLQGRIWRTFKFKDYYETRVQLYGLH